MAANVKIDWPASPANELVTDYKVYQSTDGVNYAVAATVQTNTHTILGVNGTVYWKIAAVNLSGEGPQSDPVNTPPAPGQVGQPTISIV